MSSTTISWSLRVLFKREYEIIVWQVKQIFNEPTFVHRVLLSPRICNLDCPQTAYEKPYGVDIGWKSSYDPSAWVIALFVSFVVIVFFKVVRLRNRFKFWTGQELLMLLKTGLSHNLFILSILTSVERLDRATDDHWRKRISFPDENYL